MQTIIKSPYGLILLILQLAGIELFFWFYLYQIGYLDILLESDQSRVSALIILIYLLANLHIMLTGFHISRHFIDQQQCATVGCRNPLLNRFYFQVYTRELSDSDRQGLIEVLDTRIRSRYAFGFIVADLMLKLGILGTVIGFIIMLGSLSNLNSVDITVMQTLLVEMSGGMKVALFTTLAGMLAGIVLNVKYNLLDWAVDHLMNDIHESLLQRV
jgi:hypothetical protein